MKLTCQLAAFCGLASGAVALVAPRTGYEVVDSIGTYQITPGGDWVTLNGTVQEVHSQLLKLNPNYDTDFPEGEADDGGSTRAARDLLDIDIGKTGRYRDRGANRVEEPTRGLHPKIGES
ncbi:hypothetical protein VFPBJ_00020 [Purpureocillium lilacinum]|uniref:Uncharacterized protein n=1 Tax=Purpureocillium lilacinum TaxID=33203 RepID=A0A179H8M2_PURLI|nr:hypothetical protein VFPBJ_00020 [Purpureocillium lilacinum]